MTVQTRVEAHLQQFLGEAARYTAGRSGDIQAPFRVATFLDQPAGDALTLVTVGLSDTPLGEPPVRQELLLCAWQSQYAEVLYDTLFELGHEMQSLRVELPHGTVMQMPAPLYPGGPQQLLIYTPTYFDEAFTVVPGDPPVDLIWLIPLTPRESDFILTGRGFHAFENILETEDPDLLDLHRASVV